MYKLRMPSKFILIIFAALAGILGGCYTDGTVGYHVHGAIAEQSKPWRMLSDPAYNNIHSQLFKPGLEISFYMGAKWKQNQMKVDAGTMDSWEWESYKVIGKPFPVAIAITGGVWAGKEQFDEINLDEKKVFLIRQGAKIPAHLVFAEIREKNGQVRNRYQLEFDTELSKTDQFQLVIGDGLRGNNQVIAVPVIFFEGDRGHSETKQLFSGWFVSH